MISWGEQSVLHFIILAEEKSSKEGAREKALEYCC